MRGTRQILKIFDLLAIFCAISKIFIQRVRLVKIISFISDIVHLNDWISFYSSVRCHIFEIRRGCNSRVSPVLDKLKSLKKSNCMNKVFKGKNNTVTLLQSENLPSIFVVG